MYRTAKVGPQERDETIVSEIHKTTLPIIRESTQWGLLVDENKDAVPPASLGGIVGDHCFLIGILGKECSATAISSVLGTSCTCEALNLL